MKRKISLGLLLVMLASLFLLTGCQGNPLPDGMEEDTVLAAGREIVTLLNSGDYQAVYDQMREDGQASTSAADIETYMQTLLDKVGAYVSERDPMTTGQALESTGEEYGTAVLYCKHAKKDVMYRIAYSTDMELMGFEATKK